MKIVLELDWITIGASVIAFLSILANVFSAIGSIKSADVATQALGIAEKAAQAAIEANNLNQKAFVSSQRPWVVVEKIYPNTSLDLAGGLSFTFVIKNVGNSPAMNVEVSSVMHLPQMGDAHAVHKEIGENQKKEIKKLDAFPDVNFGHLLAPGEQFEISVRTGFDRSEFQKAASFNPFGEILILILGQVSYKFGIDDSWHESGFIFSVRKQENNGIFINDNIIAIDQLKIQRFSAGFYAT